MFPTRLAAASVAALALLAGVLGFVRTEARSPRTALPHDPPDAAIDAAPPEADETIAPVDVYERTASAGAAAFAYREEPASGSAAVSFIGLVDLRAGFQRMRLGTGIEVRAAGSGGIDLREPGQDWRAASEDERIVLAHAWERIGVREILLQLRGFEGAMERVGDGRVRGVQVVHWSTPESDPARVAVWLDAEGRAHRVVVGRDPVMTLDLWDHGITGPFDGGPLPTAVPADG